MGAVYLGQCIPQRRLVFFEHLEEVPLASITDTARNKPLSTTLLQYFVTKLRDALVGLHPVVVTTSKDTISHANKLAFLETFQPFYKVSRIVGRLSYLLKGQFLLVKYACRMI
jgi:hypothetical protein